MDEVQISNGKKDWVSIGTGWDGEVGRELEGGQSGIYEQRKLQFTGGGRVRGKWPPYHTLCTTHHICTYVPRTHQCVWHLYQDDVWWRRLVYPGGFPGPCDRSTIHSCTFRTWMAGQGCGEPRIAANKRAPNIWLPSKISTVKVRSDLDLYFTHVLTTKSSLFYR